MVNKVEYYVSWLNTLYFLHSECRCPLFGDRSLPEQLEALTDFKPPTTGVFLNSWMSRWIVKAINESCQNIFDPDRQQTVNDCFIWPRTNNPLQIFIKIHSLLFDKSYTDRRDKRTNRQTETGKTLSFSSAEVKSVANALCVSISDANWQLVLCDPNNFFNSNRIITVKKTRSYLINPTTSNVHANAFIKHV